MFHRFLATVLTVAMASATALSESQNTTLDRLLAAALSSSPAALEIDAKQAESLGEALAISLKPNPEVSAEVRQRVGGTKGDLEYEIGLEQRIRPGDFGLRTKVRELLDEAARSKRGASVVELSQKIKLLYSALWASQEQARYLKETREHALRISRTVRQAASQGLLSSNEARLFTAEASRLQAEQIGTRGEQRRSEAELLRLTSLSASLGSVERPVHQPLPSEASFLEDARGALPVQTRLRLATNVSRLQAELARSGAWPSIVPRLAFEHTSEGEDRINVGFSVDLPFFDRNQPERIKSEAKERAARAEEQFALDGRFTEELKLRYQSAADLLEQQRTYESQVIPDLKAAFDALEKQYQAGQGSVLILWQAQRELLETRQRSLELWLKAAAARLELAAFIGREL